MGKTNGLIPDCPPPEPAVLSPSTNNPPVIWTDPVNEWIVVEGSDPEPNVELPWMLVEETEENATPPNERPPSILTLLSTWMLDAVIVVKGWENPVGPIYL